MPFAALVGGGLPEQVLCGMGKRPALAGQLAAQPDGGPGPGPIAAAGAQGVDHRAHQRYIVGQITHGVFSSYPWGGPILGSFAIPSRRGHRNNPSRMTEKPIDQPPAWSKISMQTHPGRLTAPCQRRRPGGQCLLRRTKLTATYFEEMSNAHRLARPARPTRPARPVPARAALRRGIRGKALPERPAQPGHGWTEDLERYSPGLCGFRDGRPAAADLPAHPPSRCRWRCSPTALPFPLLGLVHLENLSMLRALGGSARSP